MYCAILALYTQKLQMHSHPIPLFHQIKLNNMPEPKIENIDVIIEMLFPLAKRENYSASAFSRAQGIVEHNRDVARRAITAYIETFPSEKEIEKAMNDEIKRSCVTASGTSFMNGINFYRNNPKSKEIVYNAKDIETKYTIGQIQLMQNVAINIVSAQEAERLNALYKITLVAYNTFGDNACIVFNFDRRGNWGFGDIAFYKRHRHTIIPSTQLI